MKKYNCDLIIPFELNKTYIYEITKVKNNEECRNNLVHKQLLDYSIYADQVNKYRGDLSITKYLFFFLFNLFYSIHSTMARSSLYNIGPEQTQTGYTIYF